MFCIKLLCYNISDFYWNQKKKGKLNNYIIYLTLFRLGFFGHPWTGGWRQTPPPPLHFLKTIEDIDMKLTTLIKCREINPLLLSYLSCDVTKVPSWIFMAAILDFRTLS